MKVKKFLTILIILLSFITFSYSQDQIVYLDLDKVVSNTKAGKSILIKLEKSKKNALLNFEKNQAIKPSCLFDLIKKVTFFKIL